MAHRCSYCGKGGHKRPTCPTRRASLAVGGTGLSGSTKEETVPKVPGTSAKKKALTAWQIAEEVLPHCSRTLLYGPPGTGKTTAANFNGSPIDVYNVTLTEEMPAAELRGHFVPKGGEFVWMDGPALTAYRNGGRLVLNEIDRGSSDALIFCYALLDDPGISKISLPTGEHVRPHADFTVVATTNGEPSDLPEALADRFDVCILIDKPHPEAMKSLPDDLRGAAANSVSGTGDSRVSFRSWRSFADLREKVGEDIAAKAVFGVRSQSILDTLKLTRVKTYTVEDETVAEREFLVGDLVRLYLPGNPNHGKEIEIKELKSNSEGDYAAGVFTDDGLTCSFYLRSLELITPVAEETEEDEPRGVAGFMPGDRVRVIGGSGVHVGKEYTVAASKSGDSLADWYASHGKILVGDRGEYHFLPSELELLF